MTMQQPETPRYGTVMTAAQLAPPPLPRPRGPLSAYLAEVLAGPVRRLSGWPDPGDDVLFGDDGALSLYCLYELHYRGWDGVDDGWEWEPSLLECRRGLEEELAARLAQEVARQPAVPFEGDVEAALHAVISLPGGPSVSRWLAEHGTLEQFRDYAAARSILQLKEADPHAWAIPRLGGAPKAALVEIEADEFGNGVERDMHQTLFGLTLLALGLDPSYGAYVDRAPASALATATVPSFFGLHRAHRGAVVGHLAVFEMTSVEPMSTYAAALRRLGLGSDARHFYEVHVVADAHHRTVAARALAGGLVAQDPSLAADVLFGARAVTAVEGRCSADLLAAWRTGTTAMRPAPVPAAA